MAKANAAAPDAAAETKEPAAAPAAVDVVKTNFKKIKVKDFRGSYGNAVFDDNGVGDVDEVTYKSLTEQFPGAEITELD